MTFGCCDWRTDGAEASVLNLKDIHIHDCELIGVTELTDSDELRMHIRYPVDWREERYEPVSVRCSHIQ